MAWSPPSLSAIGNNDPSVSPYLKAWVIQGNTCVCGVIGEGTSQEIIANWNSPFEEDSLGGRFQKVGGLVQYVTGQTSKGKLASQQIWEGNRPHTFNLSLKFYALADAKKEVMDPIKALEKMIAPQVNAVAPGGRIPFPVDINIGRIALYSDCVIASMTAPLDKEKTKDGYLVRATVELQIETMTMLNQTDIDRTIG
ncbi:MAG: hypothetical protein WDK95_16735 [Syntrophorhabdaceae bacterium]|jgi:hypothetical protein